MQKPEITDLAYAAGVIDSDGSVGVGRNKTKRPGVYRYYANVRVSMKLDDVPLWFQSMFGGHLGRKKQKDNWPALYVWTLNCRPAADFLEQILPYLKLKYVRAAAAIELARLARPHSGPGRRRFGRMPLTLKELEEQQYYGEIIRSENMKTNERVRKNAKCLVN